MIAITSKSRYAVRALSELARAGGVPGGAPVPIGELARRRDIPVQFLEQLFATLRRAGMLTSQRGVKGGYAFAREPADVTVLEVVQALDGTFEDGGGENGRPEGGGVWAEAVGGLRERLGAVTIADIVQREARAAGAQMYHI